jgi:transcriptional regulator of NAD metabolism
MTDMTASERRGKIEQLLRASDKPLSASALAAKVGVSRQIVVGDVALLRAGGFLIDATPRGYLVHAASPSAGYSGMLACLHSTEAQLREELYTVVDNGGTVEDVAVENPLYGELRATLHITSRYDADAFLRRAAAQPQGLLSRMTGGVHLHTILCENEAAFARIRTALGAAGLLYQKGNE